MYLTNETILDPTAISSFLTAAQDGIGMFTSEPLNYVVIAGVIGFGVCVVLRIFGKLRKRA